MEQRRMPRHVMPVPGFIQGLEDADDLLAILLAWSQSWGSAPLAKNHANTNKHRYKCKLHVTTRQIGKSTVLFCNARKDSDRPSKKAPKSLFKPKPLLGSA